VISASLVLDAGSCPVSCCVATEETLKEFLRRNVTHGEDAMQKPMINMRDKHQNTRQVVSSGDGSWKLKVSRCCGFYGP
jgi:hypothetical protein